MIKTKHAIAVFLIITLFPSCLNKSNNSNADKSETAKANDGKKYVLTIYKDKINSAGHKFEPDNRIDTVTAINDTVAYLNALKSFYNQKIIERKEFNYGQPKSFNIVDGNGVDLKVNLSDKIISGLKNQVENTPDVKKMLEEYQKDSL
ncbi:MAG: hypothetical protein V4520_03745 [Bacteroidota bacterium]